MKAEGDAVAGDVVYLLAEVQSGGCGQVHEIGSHARVLRAEGDKLTLAVDHGRAEDVVTCPRYLVARRRGTASPRRVPSRPELPPAA